MTAPSGEDGADCVVCPLGTGVTIIPLGVDSNVCPLGIDDVVDNPNRPVVAVVPAAAVGIAVMLVAAVGTGAGVGC